MITFFLNSHYCYALETILLTCFSRMALLAAETDFGLALLRESEEKGSFVFSPLSIALALSLVHAGAKGTTRSQIGNALVRGLKIIYLRCNSVELAISSFTFVCYPMA